MVPGIFKIALRLRDQHIFIRQSLDILTVFNTFTLQQILWIKKNFFKKLECRFLVESARTENTSFPYNTAMSEVITKWTYHKE